MSIFQLFIFTIYISVIIAEKNYINVGIVEYEKDELLISNYIRNYTQNDNSDFKINIYTLKNKRVLREQCVEFDLIINTNSENMDVWYEHNQLKNSLYIRNYDFNEEIPDYCRNNVLIPPTISNMLIQSILYYY